MHLRANCANQGTRPPESPCKTISAKHDSHDVVLDLYEELLHGEDVVGDVERPDGHQEGGVVQADQLTQHLAPDLALNQ